MILDLGLHIYYIIMCYMVITILLMVIDLFNIIIYKKLNYYIMFNVLNKSLLLLINILFSWYAMFIYNLYKYNIIFSLFIMQST